MSVTEEPVGVPVRVNKLVMTFIASIITVVFVFGGIVLANRLPHYLPVENFGLHYLVSLVFLIVIHEALHGYGCVRFAGVSRQQISFGMNWYSFYCHCAVPMPVHAYRRMAMLPLQVTGGLTVLLLLLFPMDLTGAVAGTALAAAIGDVWIIMKLRPFAANSIVRDHPTELGCDILPLPTR